MDEFLLDRPATAERKMAADYVQYEQDCQWSLNDTFPRYLFSERWDRGPFVQGGEWKSDERQTSTEHVYF